MFLAKLTAVDNCQYGEAKKVKIIKILYPVVCFSTEPVDKFEGNLMIRLGEGDCMG